VAVPRKITSFGISVAPSHL